MLCCPLAAHKNFTKKGNDLYTNLDVDVFDALLEPKIDVKHFENTIQLQFHFNTTR